MKITDDKIIFKSTIHQIGGSTAILLPKEIIEKLELEKEKEVNLMIDKGTHGIYCAVWNPKQQKE